MRNTIRSTIPLALALLLAGCGASPEERLARAEKAYGAHDYTTARIDLGSVIQEEPENPRALELQARTFLALSDPVGARGMLDRLERLGKLPADAAVLRGEIDLMQGHFDEALQAVANDGGTEAHRVKALAHIGKGEPDKAAAAFAAGENAPGNRGRLLADYAGFQLAAGNMTEAKRLADLAAGQKPRSLNSYLISGDLLGMNNQLEKALKTFEAGQKAYPQSRAPLLGRIRALDALGRKDDLRALVKDSLARTPDDPDLIYFDARLDALDGNWRAVREKLQAHEHALEQQPEANALYAEALLELGQGEQARLRLSSQLLREPGNRQVRLLLGETKLRLGDASGALETLLPFGDMPDATDEEMELLAKARQGDRS
jgi:tetratricopeptide (TPR) repeat protein